MSAPPPSGSTPPRRGRLIRRLERPLPELLSSAPRSPAVMGVVASDILAAFGIAVLGWERWPVLFLFWADQAAGVAALLARMVLVRWYGVFAAAILSPGFATLLGLFFIAMWFAAGLPHDAGPGSPVVALKIAEAARLVWPALAGIGLGHAAAVYRDLADARWRRETELGDYMELCGLWFGFSTPVVVLAGLAAGLSSNPLSLLLVIPVKIALDLMLLPVHDEPQDRRRTRPDAAC